MVVVADGFLAAVAAPPPSTPFGVVLVEEEEERPEEEHGDTPLSSSFSFLSLVRGLYGDLLP